MAIQKVKRLAIRSPNFAAESVYDPLLGKIRFAVYDKAKDAVTYADTVKDPTTDEVIYPQNGGKGRLLEKRTVLLPSQAVEYHDEKNLIEEIEGFIRMYMVLPDSFYLVAAHYVLMSWLADAYPSVPYLRARGDTGPQPFEAKVLTPSGWTTMGALKIGDHVVSYDGTPAKVTGVFPQGEKDVYRVTMNDGTSTECCDDHLWLTRTATDRMHTSSHKRYRPFSVVNLKHIRETLTTWKDKRLNHSIPVTKPVMFDERPVSIDPYVVGVLLGDGGLSRPSSVTFTSADEFIVGQVTARVSRHRVVVKKSKSRYGYSLVKPERGGKDWGQNDLLDCLRQLNLHGTFSHDKFIPAEYKYNSSAVRLDVLRGLMDTDGYVTKNGAISLCTTSSKLASDVQEIVQSLGGIATTWQKRPFYKDNLGRRVPGKTAYIVNICLPRYVNPFSLPRKRDRVVPRTTYQPNRFIQSVELVGKKECQCITVDHPSQTYLTDSYIVTHNSGKSRMIKTVGAICYCPIMASGATSVSPIFRIYDMFPRATFIFDEMDWDQRNDEYGEITKLLNVGYERGGCVLRSAKEGENIEPQAFDVFGPKILATRNIFTDSALESRCFTVGLRGDMNVENIPENLGESFWANALDIRNKLLLWRFRRFEPCEEMPNLAIQDIPPRLRMIMTPMIVVREKQESRDALIAYLRTLRDDFQERRSMDLEAQILEHVLILMDEQNPLMPEARPPVSITQVMERVNAKRKEEGEEEMLSTRKIISLLRTRLNISIKRNGRGNQNVIADTEEYVRTIAKSFGIVMNGHGPTQEAVPF